MIRTLSLAIGLAFAAAPALAQPFIFHRSIVNAASYAPPGLPSGSLARGSIFSIFGRNLGPATPAKASTYPLGTTLAGVSIQVCRDTSCAAAIPIYVSPGQINAILPSNAPLGSGTLRITYNNQPGNFAPIEVVPTSVGIFAFNSGGFGPGIVQNFVTAADTPINSATASAKPAQFAILWATGLGASLNGDTVEPQAGNLPVTVEVFVGGKPARVEYSGRAPCCAGLDQIVFVIPNDVPVGCNVPVAVRAGGVASNDVTVAITSDGRPCTAIADPMTAARIAGGRLGRIFVKQVATSGISGSNETAYGAFTVEAASDWGFHPDFNTPPEGACLTYISRGSIAEIAAITAVPPSVRRFDAGPQLTITTTKGSLPIPPRPLNLTGYFNQIAISDPEFQRPSILTAGVSARVSAPGGGDLGAFEVTLTPPAAPQWTNAAALGTISRQEDLVVTYQPLPSETRLWIGGGGTDETSDSFVSFLCRVPPATGRFTIPAHVLSRVPAYKPARTDQFLEMSIGTLSSPPAPSGLDKMFTDATTTVSREVRFR